MCSPDRDRYFNTLSIKYDEIAKRRRALNRAYALRTFEIEHYWKRATYFWGFQIAIFAAFGLLSKRDTAPIEWGIIPVALSGLGVLTAFANSLSASGSKFWQQNWERHIDMLEDEIEGRLHKTIWLPEGKASYSVSGINSILSSFIILFWIVVFLHVTYKFVGSPPLQFNLPWFELLIVVAGVAAGAALLCRQTSGLPGTRPKQDGTHADAPISRCTRWHRRISPSQTFIRRYAPDEPNKGEIAE
jgi:hypothetical protein